MRGRLRFVLISIINFLTVPVLLSTLFEPWKRDQARLIGGSLIDELHLFWLNLLSRLVGLVVRLAALFAAALGLLAASIAGSIAYLAWLGFPLIAILFIVWGLRA